MRLASVRALKEELLDTSVTMVESVASTSTLAAFSATASTVTRTMHGIALGVATAKKQFRLAIRLQRQGPLVTAVTEQIMKRAKGEVDIKYVGEIVKFAGPTQPAFYRATRRPLRIGSSISDLHDTFVSAGTLGCFVAGRQSPHYIGMLTNNHVIGDENGNPLGAPIVQPGALDEGIDPDDLVGELGIMHRMRKNQTNLVDAAVGWVYDDIDFDTKKIGNLGDLQGQGDVTELPEKAAVFKVGRTTGQTEGRLTAFDVDNVQVEYDLGVLRFDGQIEIEGAAKKAFSRSGDSGSLIVDENLNAIGLLFAGGDQGGTNGQGLTYANPIATVLNKLKVDLEI